MHVRGLIFPIDFTFSERRVLFLFLTLSYCQTESEFYHSSKMEYRAKLLISGAGKGYSFHTRYY